MISHDYGWKRFWCPREGFYSLADRGFLVDPEGRHLEQLNPALITFEKLKGFACLVLLGEPGIGKTWTLRREALSAEPEKRGARSIRLDLRQFASEDRLCRSLFESAEFRNWNDGDGDLHLYLDSLDECLIRIDNVATILADEIPKYSVRRLKLRIACRTASWPPLLERCLSEQYGKKDFGVFELQLAMHIDD